MRSKIRTRPSTPAEAIRFEGDGCQSTVVTYEKWWFGKLKITFFWGTDQIATDLSYEDEAKNSPFGWNETSVT